MHWVVFCSLMLLQVVVSLKIIAGKNEVSPDQKSTTDCITFHGEDMLMGGRQTRISIVWYGDWTKDTKGTMQLVTDFITNVDDSDYWKIVRSYGKGGSMSVDKSIHVLAPTGSSSLTQKEAINITSSAMRRGLLPDDDDTIYVFIPSKEITEVDGLCTKYVCTVCPLHAFLFIFACLSNSPSPPLPLHPFLTPSPPLPHPLRHSAHTTPASSTASIAPANSPSSATPTSACLNAPAWTVPLSPPPPPPTTPPPTA